MEVICAQLTATQNKAENLTNALDAIKKASNNGGDLILFPEFFMYHASENTGMLLKDIAEPLDGNFVSRLAEAAAKYNIYIVCGVYEQIKNDDLVYNTIVTLNKSGKLVSKYRKTHLCDSWNVNESRFVKAGTNKFEVLQTEFGKIGIIVCYELRYPEISRYLTLEEIDILLIPAAWYSGGYREEHWKYLAKARAIENTIFVCAANQGNEPFCGRSVIIDPLGIILSSAGIGDELIKSSIDLTRLKNARKSNPCLSNIVNNLYTSIV